MTDTLIDRLLLPLPTPARSASRADHVYFSLRDDIFEMRLLPGDRVTEGSIAERFDVSRTPAREALQRLQSDGLMQGYVRGGWEVVPIDFKRFDDLYEMRTLIETFAIRKLFSAHPRLASDLEALLDELDATWNVAAARRIRDGREVAALDEAFHHALVCAAGNEELSNAMQRVTDRIRVVRRLDFVYGDCIDDTYDEHVAILRAIRDRQAERSVVLIARHIEDSQAEVRCLTVHRLQGARTAMKPDSAPYAPPRTRRTS
jgi:DNA-binding GntR family transcriptional regulator